MKEEKNIDDLFRSSFEDFEVAPPAAVKEAIDRQIGHHSRKRFWWFVLLLLLAGSGALAYVMTSAPQKTTSASRTHSAITSTSSAGRGGPSGSAAAESASRSGTTPQQTTGGTTADATIGRGNATFGRSGNAQAPKRYATSGTAKKGRLGKKAAAGTNGSREKGGKKAPGNNNGKTGIKPAGSSGVLANNGSEGGNQQPVDGKPLTPPDPAKNGTAPPTDSVPKKEDPKTPAKPDPAEDSSLDAEINQPKDKPSADEKLWRASLYLGPQFALNSIQDNTPQRFSERSSFQLSGEINRSLLSGYGLSTGFHYGTRHDETVEWDTYVITDSTQTFDTIPIFGNPNFPDSITDYQIVEVWEYDSTGTTHMQVSSIGMFGIPLYVTKQFAIGEKWGVLVNAGAQFNFYNVKLTSTESVPKSTTVNDFSMALMGRVHVAYIWNQWQFSAGLNTGYDLKPAVIYEAIDRRRYFITPQIGVHFIF